MPTAAGVAKQLAYKVESQYGQAPGQASAQLLRRVKSAFNLNKETYQSEEIRTDYQLVDFRHGVSSVGGSIEGELSPGTYKDFFAAALKRDFSTTAAISSLTLSVAASGSLYTVTRSAGDFLAGGIKVGMVVRLSGGTLNADTINKNLLVVAVTATVMTVAVLNGTTMTAPQTNIASTTVTPAGKITYIPQTGHTNKSFAFEEWYSDVAQSELYLGCKIAKIGLQLPPSGISKVMFDVMGQDVANTTAKRSAVALTSQYFTSPTAQSTSGVMAAANGRLVSGGAVIANVTGLSVDIAAAFTRESLVGSNFGSELTPGRVIVTGQLTAIFDSITFRDAFWNETLTDLVFALTADNTALSEFVTIAIPAIKFGNAPKDDGEKTIVQTLPFQALLDTTGADTTADTYKTTLMVNDSLA